MMRDTDLNHTSQALKSSKSETGGYPVFLTQYYLSFFVSGNVEHINAQFNSDHLDSLHSSFACRRRNRAGTELEKSLPN